MTQSLEEKTSQEKPQDKDAVEEVNQEKVREEDIQVEKDDIGEEQEVEEEKVEEVDEVGDLKYGEQMEVEEVEKVKEKVEVEEDIRIRGIKGEVGGDERRIGGVCGGRGRGGGEG